MDDSQKIRNTARYLITIHVIAMTVPLLAADIIFKRIKAPYARLSWFDPITIGAAFLTGLFIYFSFSVYRRESTPATQTSNLKKKLKYYRQAHVLRTLTLGAVALGPVPLVLIENCYGYFIFSGIAMFLLILTWPTFSGLKDNIRVN